MLGTHTAMKGGLARPLLLLAMARSCFLDALVTNGEFDVEL